jgi:hypothetical protein
MTTVERKTRSKTKPAAIVKDLDAELFGEFEIPYAIDIKIAGVRPYFFSRPDMDSWEAKEKAAPGSKVRTDFDPEALVWRNENADLAFPSTQLKVALMAAGRFSPDPSKTGRRSAMPFIGEAFNVYQDYVSFGVKNWDAIDVRIAKYANNRFGPRRRPILNPGWRCDFTLQILVPELIRPGDVMVLVNKAGMVKGVGDNTKFGAGRFTVEGFSEAYPLKW